MGNHDTKHLVIGIRPEGMKLTDEANTITSTPCLVAEPQGSHQVVAIKHGDDLHKIIAPPYPKVKPGEIVHVTFDQDAIHFFDKKTGKRIEEDT
jgi:multiple sugar transport system ATP-binding protein